MNNPLKNILRSVMALTAAAAAACSPFTEEAQGGDPTVEVTMHVSAGREFDTRSSFGWGESEIRDIEVVVTEEDGTVCDVLYAAPPADLHFTGTAGHAYRLWAAANLGGKVEVTDIGDLTSQVRSITAAGIASSGIPMFNGSEGQSIVLKEGPETVTIPLTRMVARVDLSVDKHLLSDEALFNIRSVDICNAINAYSPFTSAARQERTGSIDYSFDSASAADISALNSGGTASMYAFENMQGTLLPGNTDPWKKVPSSIGNAGKYCTYLEIHCTYGSGSHDVTYRMYLGKDATTNFDVERNTVYRVTLIPTEDEVRGGRGSWKVEAEPWNEVTDVKFVISPSSVTLKDDDEDYTRICSRITLTYEDGSSKTEEYPALWTAPKATVKLINTPSGSALNKNSAASFIELKGAGSGNGTITATATYDGKEYTATCQVKVTHTPVYTEESVYELSVTPESITLSEGQEMAFTATLVENIYTFKDGKQISWTPLATYYTDVTQRTQWSVTDGPAYITAKGNGVFAWASGPGTATVKGVYGRYTDTAEITTLAHEPVVTYVWRIEIGGIDPLEVGESATPVVTRYRDTYEDGVLKERDETGETISGSILDWGFGTTPGSMTGSDPHAEIGPDGTVTGIQPGTVTIIAVLPDNPDVYATVTIEILEPYTPPTPPEPDPEPTLTASITHQDTWGGNTYPVTLVYDDDQGHVTDVTSSATCTGISFTGGIPGNLLEWNGSKIVAKDWWGLSGSWVTASPTYTMTLSYGGLTVEISGTMHGYIRAEVAPEKPVWHYMEIEDNGWSGPAAIATLIGSDRTQVRSTDSRVTDPSRILANGFIGIGTGIPFHASFIDPSNGYVREGDSTFSVETNIVTLQVSIYPTLVVYGEAVGLVASTGQSGEFLGSAGIKTTEDSVPPFYVNINQEIWYEDYKGDAHQLTFSDGSLPAGEIVSISDGWSMKTDWQDTVYEGETRTIVLNVNGFSASWRWGHIRNQ